MAARVALVALVAFLLVASAVAGLQPKDGPRAAPRVVWNTSKLRSVPYASIASSTGHSVVITSNNNNYLFSTTTGDTILAQIARPEPLDCILADGYMLCPYVSNTTLFDARTGKLEWTAAVGDSVGYPLLSSRYTIVSTATPRYEVFATRTGKKIGALPGWPLGAYEDLVVITTPSGICISVNVTSGAQLWNRTVDSWTTNSWTATWLAKDKPVMWLTSSQPGNGDVPVAAVDLLTGEMLWNTSATLPSPAYGCLPTFAIDDVVITPCLVTGTAFYFAVNGTTGAAVWNLTNIVNFPTVLVGEKQFFQRTQHSSPITNGTLAMYDKFGTLVNEYIVPEAINDDGISAAASDSVDGLVFLGPDAHGDFYAVQM